MSLSQGEYPVALSRACLRLFLPSCPSSLYSLVMSTTYEWLHAVVHKEEWSSTQFRRSCYKSTKRSLEFASASATVYYDFVHLTNFHKICIKSMQLTLTEKRAIANADSCQYHSNATLSSDRTLIEILPPLSCFGDVEQLWLHIDFAQFSDAPGKLQIGLETFQYAHVRKANYANELEL
nr:hypothetical protein CFP56_13124 [Quercus suber]